MSDSAAGFQFPLLILLAMFEHIETDIEKENHIAFLVINLKNFNSIIINF